MQFSVATSPKLAICGLSLSALLLLSACERPLTEAQIQDAANWQAWVEKENSHSKDGQHSFLNIRDARYMRPGDTVSLDISLGAEQVRWQEEDKSNEIANSSRLTLSFDGENALISEKGKFRLITADEKFSLPNDELFITVGALHDSGLRAFIRDPNHPKVENFKGHHYYDYNPKMRTTASFTAAEELNTVSFQTVQGLTNTLVRVGTVAFKLDGESVTMSAYHESGEPPLDYLLFLFKDQTNGDTTYGGGRELVVKLAQAPSEGFIIDFNYTFNLNCAHSTFWNCPIIWDSPLELAITAGEKLPYDYE
ncbi:MULTISPECIES: DUF1684 domain-containing protein [Corallincola]|uniref:DUF1684 domain-containing protein n=2 Tax=Corallincola TaxID=1775176 RepID=A0A368NS25_9GAMM|nr:MULTISPECIES: DUF1684 domain-containing protein [Corallincola]RCU52910.1 DUF1684 domain-containing protein [Corallincola holothuriorum]TAA47936.1 DUF1684 domain-containing protein [Corallincola spongiicola]